MVEPLPAHTLQLQSLVTADATVELTLQTVALPMPTADEVVVRVQAAPVHPSDLVLLLAGADPATLRSAPSGTQRLTGRLTPRQFAAAAARVGTALTTGNEGAGVVVAAGESAAAQALVGRTVASMAGGMYTTLRCLPAASCLPLPAGMTAAQGAGALINPLTSLGMVDILGREGHAALVHTAAASTVGRMLQRVCSAQGIGLVNVVRSAEQAALLRSLGAGHVCVLSAPDFDRHLLQSLVDTGATLAFDAIGGGALAGRILDAMERAFAMRVAAGITPPRRDGLHKQVCLYGRLDPAPVAFDRSFGSNWSLSGWMMSRWLERLSAAEQAALKDRVALGVTDLFATRYARSVALAELLQPQTLADAARRTTGGKLLVEPGA